MSEYPRPVNLVRIPVDDSAEIQEVADITAGLFESVGSHARSLIMFGHDSVNDSKDPVGTFYVIEGVPSVFFNPDKSLPPNGRYTDKPLADILTALEKREASFFQISDIEFLGKDRSYHALGQTGAAFRSYKSQAEQDFRNQTHLSMVIPFRIEGPTDLTSIRAGQLITVGPLVIDNFRSLRQGWNRAGIA